MGRKEVVIGAILRSAWIALAFGAAGFAGWYLSEPAETVAEAPAETVQASVVSEPEPARQTTGETAVATRRIGLHHLVAADVTGPGGSPVPVTLVVDTGATSVVLPASLIDELGYDETQLRNGVAQTARGRVQVKIGELSRIEIGGPENAVGLNDVEVAFVKDAYLNGSALLGMSFLGRFRVTFDDANDRIILAENL